MSTTKDPGHDVVLTHGPNGAVWGHPFCGACGSFVTRVRTGPEFVDNTACSVCFSWG